MGSRVLLAGFVGSALFFGAAGCTGDKRSAVPTVVPAQAPILTLEPPPGAYDAYVLDVRIVAADPKTEIAWGLNRQPVTNGTEWVKGSFSLRLLNSAGLQVSTRDAQGKVWGPYTFEYSLAQREQAASCRIFSPERLYFAPAQPIVFELGYSLPSALAEVELTIDGETVSSYVNQATPRDVTTYTISAPTQERGYEMGCRVVGPALEPTEGNSAYIYVDGTSPTAQWSFFGASTVPTHFRVESADLGGAGIDRAELCDASFTACLPMRREGGVFTFATAFLPGIGGGFDVRARVYDRAGNTGVIAPVTIALSNLPSGSPPYVNSVTLTAAPTLDLGGLLVADGQNYPLEVRELDFDPLPPGDVPLMTGWNEFLFLPPGQPHWQTFGIYVAGATFVLPAGASGIAHDWLVYASQSTIPAMQAARLTRVPVGTATFDYPNFDVPRFFFVEDLGNDGDWDDHEPLYLPVTTDAGGKWLASGTPVYAALAEAVTYATLSTQSTSLACADCAPTGSLILQRRADRYGPPVGRVTMTTVDLSLGPVAGHAFSADAFEYCTFFWDEDGNGVTNGSEPRASGACDTASFSLNRSDVLSIASVMPEFRIAGIPYGGKVTGRVAIDDANGQLVTRSPWFVVRDLNGNGMQAAPLPQYARWPSQIRLWSKSTTAAAASPGLSDSVTTSVTVEVTDENGVAVSAAVSAEPASVLSSLSSYAVYTAGQPAVELAYDPDYPPRLRALRDGYVSEWYYMDSTVVTLRIVSAAAAGRAEGYVFDAVGSPVTGASIEWRASPYASWTSTDESGWFSLPVIGTGRLQASDSEGSAHAEAELTVASGELATQTLTLPSSKAWPVGMQGEYRVSGVTGPSAATLFSNDEYVWGSLVNGDWALTAEETFQRLFSLPGAIPVFAFSTPFFKFIPFSTALLESELSVRCGARRQAIPFGVSPQVDSPCWEWYARWGGREYFIGRLHPEDPVPDAGLRIWSGAVYKDGVVAPNGAFRLRDLLFNRTIDVTANSSGQVRTLLPHGLYRAETLGGTAMNDDAGAPALLSISHASASYLKLVLP